MGTSGELLRFERLMRSQGSALWESDGPRRRGHEGRDEEGGREREDQRGRGSRRGATTIPSSASTTGKPASRAARSASARVTLNSGRDSASALRSLSRRANRVHTSSHALSKCNGGSLENDQGHHATVNISDSCGGGEVCPEDGSSDQIRTLAAGATTGLYTLGVYALPSKLPQEGASITLTIKAFLDDATPITAVAQARVVN